MNGWLAGAAALSAVTFGLHVVLGGREAARPLLAASELDQVAKYTNYYCWHLVTIIIGALAVAFCWASVSNAAHILAVFATGISLIFAAWSLGMIARFRLPPMQFGQWALFLPIALLGLAGSIR